MKYLPNGYESKKEIEENRQKRIEEARKLIEEQKFETK